jgi:membrane protein YqaA with SNARE-associated domain
VKLSPLFNVEFEVIVKSVSCLKIDEKLLPKHRIMSILIKIMTIIDKIVTLLSNILYTNYNVVIKILINIFT